MSVLDDNLVDAIESIYFDVLVNIIMDHNVSRSCALSIARDFFDIMHDY